MFGGRGHHVVFALNGAGGRIYVLESENGV